MRAFRWPAVLAIPAVMIAAARYDADNRPDGSTTIESALPASLASVVLDRPVSWFCVAGRASDAHEVTIVNVGTEPAVGTVTVFGSAPADGSARPEPVTEALSVEAGGRLSLPLDQVLAGAEWLSATVELDGGQTVVNHSVSGVNGGDSEPCADRGSSTWYEPWGTTVLGAELSLVLFNPFPEDAVVDVSFATENGVREPSDFQSIVVPGRSVVPLAVGGTETPDAEDLLADGQLDETDVDLGGPITVADRVSAAVVVRSGRIVAERMQDLDPLESDGLQGLVVGLPSPATAEAWVFPTGRLDEGIASRLVVFNPSDEQAEVDVEVITDDPSIPVEPFELTVLARQSVTVDLDQEPRMAEVSGFSLLVRSVNSVPMVASRIDTVTASILEEQPVPTTTTTVIPEESTTTIAEEGVDGVDETTTTAPGDGDETTDESATTTVAPTTTVPPTTTTAPSNPASQPGGTAFEIVPGVAVSRGVSMLATRQIIVLTGAASQQGSTLALVNPDFASPNPAQVTIRVFGDGATTDALAVEVGPGRRVVVDLDDLGIRDLVLVVESTTGVAAEVEQLRLASRLLVPSVPAISALVPIPGPNF